MALAKVHNDNFLPFTQEFEGKTVHIEANHYITMDHEKARMFASKYFPMQKDVGGQQKPESYKKIRVEVVGDKKELVEIDKLRCQACAFIGNTKEELDEHITERHIHLMYDKDEVKKRKRTA